MEENKFKKKPLYKPELLEVYPEIEAFFHETEMKYTISAYGWSDDTLMMYPEENFKHMFYMCKDKNGYVPYNRRFIYYVKPHSFEDKFSFNRNLNGLAIQGTNKVEKVKFNINSSKVIQLKDPFLETVPKITHEDELLRIKKELNSAIKAIDKLINITL